MIILVYLAGLFLLARYSKKNSRENSPVLVLAYNYVFSALMMAWVYLGDGVHISGWQDAAYRLMLAFYHGFTAITFYLKTDLCENLQSMFGYRPLLLPVPLQVLVVSYIASILVVRFVLLTLFRDAVEKMRSWWLIRFSGHLYLLRGEKKDVDLLAADIRAHVKRPAILFLYRDGRETGTGGTETEAVLSLLRTGKVYDIVLLPLAGDANISLLHALNKKSSEGVYRMRVTAFADNDMLRFGDLRFPDVDSYIVSSDSLLVNRFLSEHPPVETLRSQSEGMLVRGLYRPSRPFRLALIGFSALAQEFLLQTYERTGFFIGDDSSSAPERWGLEVSVVDGDLNRMKEGFLRDVPYFSTVDFIAWHDMWTESAGFYDLFREPFDQILISTSETERNVRMAKRIYRMQKQMGRTGAMPQILVVLRDHILCEMTPQTLSSEYASEIELLQANEAQFSYDEMILRKTDEEARALHERYISDRGAGKEWWRLSSFTRESNRAVIRDISNKQALGQAIGHLAGEARNEALWEMARYEHRRWMAFHYAHGWMPLAVSGLTKQETDSFVTKHTDEKRHICLVSWEELDALPQREKGILKWYDYANVLSLFDKEREKAQKDGKDKEV